MIRRTRLKLVPLGDGQELEDAFTSGDFQTLGDLLACKPAFGLEPLTAELLAKPLDHFILVPMEGDAETPLFRPPGLTLKGAAPSPRPQANETEKQAEAGPAPAPPVHESGHPESLDEKTAVLKSYARTIERVASFLRADLSVLIYCDKLVVEHLWRPMVTASGKEPQLLELPADEEDGLMPRGMRQRQIAALRSLIAALKIDQVLVVPHLDLLTGGSDENPNAETRDITELVYGAGDRLLLAFADRSISIPEVLASRFALRLELIGVPREVPCRDGVQPLCTALVTRAEAERFTDFNADDLYKNVSGMNPVRIRQAIRYAVEEHLEPDQHLSKNLVDAIRAFKIQTTARFEVPDVNFDHIGGYDGVKAQIFKALRIMSGAYRLPEKVGRGELIPRGFIFHGPPGTGKTLFAKAVANRLNATILVVSGPEITDMYVGESERKVRDIFAEARRNAPAVIVFDEFDSIAVRRSSREDGGSRAGNAVVAQILTEMDGFRPDVPMLVIGTTNRLDIIDDALLRPSRFQAIAVGLPDLAARLAIARVHAGHFEVEVADSLLQVIAEQTEGFNGDEIRSLFREACVGRYCEDPPQPADSRRFGRLVGKLRASRESIARVAAEHGPLRTNPNERVRPSSPMSPLPETPRTARPRPEGDMNAVQPGENEQTDTAQGENP
ncbi:MAG: ATP-binding protein [Acidobacteriota bacterium]|nr:ATP-binding protein [Acidobacteriota bacterium]